MNVKEIQLPFDVELLPVRKLKAGDLSCAYEAGNLRYIKQFDTELIRMIYGAVRDENWQTILPAISGEEIEENENEFTIKYAAVYKERNIHYKADFNIEGKRDNTIVFSMKGEALSDFKKNRIGLCVLHPIKEYSGREISITEPDGNIYDSTFPKLISPHQPFFNVQQMHCTINSINVHLNFEGDVFETEDQRNWTDSSYKTYSTPLHLPFPADVKAGEKIEQRVTLKVVDNARRLKHDPAEVIHEEKIAFPKIGYCRSNNQQPLTSEQIELLNQIPFDHYRVELFLDTSTWPNILSIAAKEARLLNTKLELIAFFDDEYKKKLDEFVLYLKPTKDIISSILLLNKVSKNTKPELMQQGYQIIKKRFPAMEIGYGTDGHFADLNRNLPQQNTYDFVSFSLSPQVHAFDIRTLFENLERQADTIQTLKVHIGNKKIHVSPITLKMRNNLIPEIDERQHTSAIAFWTLQCVQNLSDADSITFYQLLGDAGILSEQKSAPLYDVLKLVKKHDAKWIIKRYNNDDVMLNNFIAENANGERMILKSSLL